jgi:hypothetical protein
MLMSLIEENEDVKRELDPMNMTFVEIDLLEEVHVQKMIDNH